MTVFHVARLQDINANQIFKWRRQYRRWIANWRGLAKKLCLLLNLLLPIIKPRNSWCYVSKDAGG